MTADREALATLLVDLALTPVYPAADAILASEWLAAVKAEAAATALEDAARVATYDAECCPCGMKVCREANETTAAWLRDRAATKRGTTPQDRRPADG